MKNNKSLTHNLAGRSQCRRELLAMARSYSSRTLGLSYAHGLGENIIATGHQPVWHHCGVWSKDLAASKLAQAVNSVALHLVVDHDICDTAALLPKQNENGNWHFDKIGIEAEANALPVECRPLPQAAHIVTFFKNLTNADTGRFCSKVWAKCAPFTDNPALHLSTLADLITYSQSVLKASLGIDMLYLLVSMLADTDAFTDFAVSIMENALDFAAAYNRAVTSHIEDHAIDPRRTLRPLQINEGTAFTELPFWLLSPDGSRNSLYVTSTGGNKIRYGVKDLELGILELTGSSERELKNRLAQVGYCLRPKAVSLTLFVRLFLADWFVHGVGGARYEYVVDRIIEDYYGMQGLCFGVATTTVTFPFAGHHDDMPESTAELKLQQRRLKYNPQEYISAELCRAEPAESLIASKELLVQTTKRRDLSAQAKRSAWKSIAQINKRLQEFAQGSLPEPGEKTLLSRQNDPSHRVREYREFFFGLFSEETLRKLADSLVFAKEGAAPKCKRS
ncbi:MAG: hypothetical protein ACYTEL_09870 [Planctomycetota bacterium]